jgi:phosphatidylglycerol:prolipoprotein diacylglycerol transferase
MKPILFNLFNYPIYTYPLFVGLAWGLAYNLIQHFLRVSENKNFNFLFLGVFVFSWLGAKILFLLTSAPPVEAFQYSVSSSFWLGGGFVFYGGVLGGTAFAVSYIFLFKKYKKENTKFFFPALCFAHALGRVGCLLTGCCYGKQCDLPWAFQINGLSLHPVQLYEASFLILLGFVLLRFIKKGSNALSIALAYFCNYAFFRFLIEFLRGDKIRGLHYGVSTSQYVSIMVMIGVVIVFFFNKRKRV